MYDHIDDYLTERLKGEARSAFERAMERDQALAQEVAEQRQAIALLMKLGDAELKLEAQEAKEQYLQGKKDNPRFRLLQIGITIAASLLFLLVAFWGLRGNDEAQLFEDYYMAYDTSFGVRDRIDATEIRLAEASKLYQEQNYAQARTIFESIENIERGELLLMRGISQLETAAYDEAIASFNELIMTKDPAFQYHGYWYAAMTYLKSGDTANCKRQLQILIDAKDINGVYQQTEAKELLNKI